MRFHPRTGWFRSFTENGPAVALSRTNDDTWAHAAGVPLGLGGV